MEALMEAYIMAQTVVAQTVALMEAYTMAQTVAAPTTTRMATQMEDRIMAQTAAAPTVTLMATLAAIHIMDLMVALTILEIATLVAFLHLILTHSLIVMMLRQRSHIIIQSRMMINVTVPIPLQTPFPIPSSRHHLLSYLRIRGVQQWTPRGSSGSLLSSPRTVSARQSYSSRISK